MLLYLSCCIYTFVFMTLIRDKLENPAGVSGQFPPRQLSPGQLPPYKFPGTIAPKTIALRDNCPWTITPKGKSPRQYPLDILPDNCPPPPQIPTGQLPPGHCPHLTRNFFCFCLGTRSLSAFSVRPWVQFQGRVKLELD